MSTIAAGQRTRAAVIVASAIALGGLEMGWWWSFVPAGVVTGMLVPPGGRVFWGGFAGTLVAWATSIAWRAAGHGGISVAQAAVAMAGLPSWAAGALLVLPALIAAAGAGLAAVSVGALRWLMPKAGPGGPARVLAAESAKATAGPARPSDPVMS